MGRSNLAQDQTRNRISRKKAKPNKCTYSILNVRAESTGGKGLKIPCQNTFKDKPAFIKRLIKVLVARNMIGT